MANLRLVVLISGSGTNLKAIIDAFANETLQGEIVLVISNRKAAYGLTRAQEAGLRTLYFPLKPYKDAGESREAYDADLAEIVLECTPDLIVLAGWMHILSAAFLDHFPQQVINLHPALPGAFTGTNAIERNFVAFQNGEVSSGGVMVHYAIPELDAGPVLVQEAVPIYTDDTLEDFAARLHDTEHRLIVEAIHRHNSIIS